MTTSDWMSSLDAAFLHIETDTRQMHVGSTIIFEGPAPSYQEYRGQVEERLHTIPRYRQRVQRMPMDLLRPRWVADPHFSMSYHLRHTAIPAPGGEQQLRNLAGRIMSQRLDVDRPLWEIWLVEGLPDDRWAVITKTHHAMIDGVSGGEILEVLLDREPDRVWVAPSEDARSNQPQPRSTVNAAAAYVSRIPGDAVRAGRELVQRPTDVARAAAIRARGLALLGRQAAVQTNVLNASPGPHRRTAWVRVSLEDAKIIKRTVGCTVNDVVLAMVTGGLRTYLDKRGELAEAGVVRTMVPVSVRTPDERGRLGNQVSSMFADLPIDVEDPLGRLARISEQMNHLKGSGTSLGIESITNAADFVPPTLLAVSTRLATSVNQRFYNLITTNVPGPPYPLYCLGRRMLDIFPYIPISQGVSISIGIISYDGRLEIAATGDYDAAPDLDDLVAAIGEAADELKAAAVG